MKEDYSAGRLSLEGLDSGPREWRGQLPPDASFWSTDELDFIDPPLLDARLEGSADGSVHVTGHLAVRLRLACRRCLGELDVPLDLPLDMWFEPAVNPDGEEDAVYGLDAGAAELDLVRPLREELLLALPEYPECTPVCAGYCPKCGADLDGGPCDCGGAEPDPRWDALRGITKKEEP